MSHCENSAALDSKSLACSQNKILERSQLELLIAYRQKEKLEGENVPILTVAGCNFPEFTPCLKSLLDALLNIAVNLMSERRLQVELPASKNPVANKLEAVESCFQGANTTNQGLSLSRVLCQYRAKHSLSGSSGN